MKIVRYKNLKILAAGVTVLVSTVAASGGIAGADGLVQRGKACQSTAYLANYPGGYWSGAAVIYDIGDDSTNYDVAVNDLRVRRKLDRGYRTVKRSADYDGFHAITDEAQTAVYKPKSGEQYQVFVRAHWRNVSTGVRGGRVMRGANTVLS